MRTKNWKIYRTAIIAFVGAVLVSGCVSFGANLDAKDLNSVQRSINGIGRVADRDGQARLLVVHGMGGDRCPGYSVSNYRFSVETKSETPGMLSSMSKALGVCLLKDPRDDEEKHCIEEDVSTYPTLRLTKFDYAKAIDGQDCGGVTVMRVYELYYTGAGEKAEQAINEYNDRVLGSSVYVNRIIKQDLMVSGFGDAVMYLGDYGEMIRDAVRGTICQMATDPDRGAENQDAICPSTRTANEFIDSEVFILSHSLGSNIVLDTIIETLSDQNKYGVETFFLERIIENVKSAYLIANQDALLGMFSVVPRELSTSNKVKVLTRLLKHEDAQVVAFSGRNDALSYALTKDACPAMETQCINAALNVARWGIPFFFANPIKAHTGYESDKTVISCVASGCD